MKIEKLISNSQQDTIKLASKIAKLAKKGDIITLRGTLGAGKTFFVNAFINAIYKQLGKKNISVTSPTFNIVKIYDNKTCPIYHFDLYRLKKSEELYELGIEEAFENGISLIEWPELAENLFKPNFLDIKIEHFKKENERKIQLTYYI